MGKINVLHLFDKYLPVTEIWAYSLIKFVPECNIFVGANAYLKNNYYSSNFYFLDHHYENLKISYERLGELTSKNLIKKIVLKVAMNVIDDPAKYFVKNIKKRKINIVHCHFAEIGWQFRNVALKNELPLIISFYGWDYEKLPYLKPDYEGKYKILFEKAFAFICEGNYGASLLRKKGCPKEKIFVIPLGVDVSLIPYFLRVKEKGALKMIQVAALTEKKGQHYALEALAQLVKVYPNISLTLVGNEREVGAKRSLLELVQKLEIEDHVNFLPHVNHNDLPELLSKFDVFIHPSCYSKDKDCEGGAPIVLLDAQATGMPVISTSHCDIPQEVIHQKTGLLSEEKDVNGLVENVKKFYDMNNDVYQRFCKLARLHIIENFDIRKNAKILRDVYNLVLKSNNAKK